MSDWKPADSTNATRVKPQALQTQLVVVANATAAVHPLPPVGRVVLGRAVECQVWLDSASVSRHHAAIEVDEALGLLAIKDLGSCSGTWLRGVQLPVGEWTPVSVGDTIQVGAVTVLVQAGEMPAPC